MNLGYQGSLDEPFQPQPVEVSEKKLGKRSFFNRRLSDQPRLIKDIIPKQVDRPTDNYGNIPWAEPVETNYYSTRNEPVDYPSSYYRTRNESVDHPANYYRTQNEFTKSDWQSTTVHNHPYTRYQKSQEIKPWDEGKTSDEILPKSENFSLELCIECQKPLSGMKWCRSCNAEHFHQQTSKWTSWRLGLDNVIIETQIAANNAHSLYEWIPFEDFDHITYLAKGGFGTVYKATWKRGPIIHWDPNIKNWTRFRNHEVILKIINGSQTNLDEFINQLTAHHKFSTIVGHLLRCFGISRWEDTGDFIIVTSCAKDGNLRQYMRKNSKRFTWIERLVTLKDIAKCLEIIHNTGYRPTAGQLVRILDDWIHSKRKQLDIIYNSFQNAELELNYINYSKEPVDEKDYTHIDETYTSKLISIKDIVNRINQEKLQQKK
ncbi:unnamed protein product [Rhizophagus irregularis]|nr:unnamed protein product [Rhizophagus irregularis]CAB5209979.1 unnamed protein product [Rhizophagus irregularis]